MLGSLAHGEIDPVQRDGSPLSPEPVDQPFGHD
jgi:hypothetical protein